MNLFVLIAFFAIAFILLIVFRRKSSSLRKKQKTDEKTDDKNLQEFTLNQLANFDGSSNSLIYIGCKNYVFDVTNSEHYKKDGSYSFFAGKDCSVALAKMSFDPVYLNCGQDLSLTVKEQAILDQWFEKFKDKYTVVGKIKY